MESVPVLDHHEKSVIAFNYAYKVYNIEGL